MFESTFWSQYNPVRIVCAPIETLNKHLTSRHVLLVTTPGFVKRGMVQRVIDILDGYQVKVWDGVKPNPSLLDLAAATQTLSALRIECVVGLGGGSALDAAKVLATTIANPAQPTLQQVFRGNLAAQWATRLPLVAIPTTSGTGAEVTPFATVWDHEDYKKYSLAGDFMYPDLALLDVKLTMTLGEEDTLYPALDAISHALESLWNKNCTPISRAFAFQSLALSNKALVLLIKEPNNIRARQDMQTASLLAGLAISQTRTAIAHAISYPFTINFGVPHGLACSFTLQKLVEVNIKKISKTEEELNILSSILKFLASLNLDEKIKKYLPLEFNLRKFLCELNEDRLKNYPGSYIDLIEIIDQNFM
jgi:phosphonate metabolism-associated iron-containing alcohol dehydrogenase